MTDNHTPLSPLDNLTPETSNDNKAEDKLNPQSVEAEAPDVLQAGDTNIAGAEDSPAPSTPSEDKSKVAGSQEKGQTQEQVFTKNEILEKLKNMAALEAVPPRSDVEALKHAFYKLRSAEIEGQKAAYISEGNNEEEFVPTIDPAEDVLKTYLSEIKDKRASLIAEEERIKEENYAKKLNIIDSLKTLAESNDDFNKLYKEFKDLQQLWNDTKPIPASKEKELWKAYQYYTEIFYDLIKINNEFRDYDFKKNLELKMAICEAAEKLTEETDAVSAFHQLQNFHNQWREIGPVARELRDEIWNRFKAASTTINKNYQTHFESLKGKEDENLEKKNTIIEKLKTIDYDVLTTMKAWDEKSREVINLQAEWKSIGFVPRKVNAQVFEEFRSLCDTFFDKKSKYFKEVKDDMEQNLEKKRALVERANALKDSEDWKKTTEAMIAIQKEWKKTGPVSRRYSDVIWKEFVSACDYFFEQKKKNFSSAKDEEINNMSAKKELTEQIKNIDISLNAQDALAKLRELTDKWHSIGFVPFRDKDKVYKEFHDAVDAQYDRLKVDRTERRFESFKSNLEDISKSDNGRRMLIRERDKLIHTHTKLKSDLQTYENNMNFLTVSSKGANNLLKDVNHKIEDLKNEMDLIAKKIESIEDSIEEIDKSKE